MAGNPQNPAMSPHVGPTGTRHTELTGRGGNEEVSQKEHTANTFKSTKLHITEWQPLYIKPFCIFFNLYFKVGIKNLGQLVQEKNRKKEMTAGV